MRLPGHVGKVLEDLRKASTILIVAHHDADGASSAGVLARALFKLDKDVDIMLIRQFYPDSLGVIPFNQYDFTLFVDLAGRYVDFLGEHLDSFFVVDHHDNIPDSPNLFHPSQMGYDPDVEASSSTLSALLAYSLFRDTKTLVYGLVGAAGDNQFQHGAFQGLNRVFVVRGLREGMLTIYRDLSLPGLQVKELPWVLLNAEPALPGLSGDEEAVYEFMERLGAGMYVRYGDLSIEERRKFFTMLALHLMRYGWSPEEIKNLIGEIYEISGNIGWMKTIRGFKSLVNGVAKLLHHELVAPLFMDDLGVLSDAERVYYAYKRSTVYALREGRKRAKDEGSFVFVDGRGLPEFTSGLLASVLSSEYGKPALVVVESGDGFIKGSLRGGKGLSSVVERMRSFGVEGGGHSEAAGFRAREEDLEKILKFLSENL